MLKQIKLLILILVLGGGFSSQLQADNKIDLNQAVENKIININVRGTDWSDHEDYGRASVLVQIENKSGGSIELRIPAGQRFLTVDKEYQDMLVIKEVILVLAPGGRKQTGLLAMCTQLRNMGPGSGTDFTVGPMADGHLLKIADYIHTHEFGDQGDAQQAVWAISDGNPINNVYNDDFRKYMSELTGREYTERARGMNRPERIATFTVNGRVEFGMNEPGNVTIAMYDTTGAEIKVVYTDEKKRGNHWHKWRFTYREGTYVMKLLINGVVKGEDTYVLKRS